MINRLPQVGFVLLLVSVGVLPACRIPPPPPDQPLLDWVINSAEFSTDFDSWSILLSKIDDIMESTNKSFGQVARINFRFTGPLSTGLTSAHPQGWPVVDPTDTQLYDNTGGGERFYATYLQDHRDVLYAFGVFWVMGPPSSFPACDIRPRVLGFNVDGTQFSDNEVTTAVKSRGVFLFAGWIDDITKCQWYQNAGYAAINLFIRVHTHELGHQRGDLTHSDQKPLFHGGPVPDPTSRVDVMHSNATSTDLRHKIPIFDQHFESATESQPCFDLTCQDNLVCWRSIKN